MNNLVFLYLQVDFGVVASVRSILGLNVGVGPFLGLNDGVKLAMASPAGVILDYWCRVGSGLNY